MIQADARESSRDWVIPRCLEHRSLSGPRSIAPLGKLHPGQIGNIVFGLKASLRAKAIFLPKTSSFG